MSAISTWSTTAASNNAAPPDGAPEGSTNISDLNDIQRELMAQVRAYAQDAQWFTWGHTTTYASASSFTISGTNVTAIYDVGRRVRIVGSSTGTVYGTITSSTFGTDTTVAVTLDSGSLVNEALTTSVHVVSGTERIKSIGASVPSGSKMMFFNNAAPAGWTFDATLNDRYVMVSSTESQGGATGGSHTLSGFSIGGTAISQSQMPVHSHAYSFTTSAAGSHQHSGPIYLWTWRQGAGNITLDRGGGTEDGTLLPEQAISAAGQHAHSFAGSTANNGNGQTHTHTISQDASWRGAYVRGIICTKN